MDVYVDKYAVAKALNVRASTVDYYRRRGMFPSIFVGKHPRFIIGDVLKAIKSNQEVRDGKCH
jgi:hypothetical protein